MRRGRGANNNSNKDANKDDEKDKEQSTNSAQQSQPSNPYENSIKQIAKVSTVEEFWLIYNHLQRPNNLPTTTDYHFFRDGIKPTWEDPSNAKGGKWIVRLRKGLASRYWEEIVLGLVGCQFTGIPYNEVCGAVVSIRYSEDIVSVWNKTAHDREITERLRDCIKKILQLPNFVHMEYKPHETSLQDKSSFRNTQVWKPKSIADGGAGGGSRRGSMPRSGSWGDRNEIRGDGGVSSKQSSWRTSN
mmetsp:Transcript_24982/g.31457  ORF Transcript_24982/g.31457 Transcript_24982/m.31457 type:complete len:245 (+) Transcript_24982:106-840(+)